jgi:LysM repeat protein
MKRKILFSFLVLVLAFTSLAARPAAAQGTSSALVCTTYHIVQRGEYLSQIAKRFGVSWRWLAEINNLANPNRIFPGQKLCVEAEEAPVCVAQHTVKRGEYLSKIARLYGVSWRWLAEINDLANPSRIYPGQVLCVELSE